MHAAADAFQLCKVSQDQTVENRRNMTSRSVFSVVDFHGPQNDAVNRLDTKRYSVNIVGTVLAFSVFSVFWAWGAFCPGFGSGFRA